ncbi:MAG: sigma-70 family RNA polymerase sigma factor [Verrucomicrobiae bacterium]|nr:sigma-70 family RNA polymerase sigma factor [Verrucomicrobiae bacterium]
MHDTFRALLRLPHSPREPRFYLVRTFRNRALNHRRSLWRRLGRERESLRWFDTPDAIAPDEAAALAALGRLPAEQREAIVLKIWHALTFEAIGDLQGVSPNTAAGRYRYGLQKLRQVLPGPSHEPRCPTRSDPAWIPPTPALPEP